MEDHGGVPSQPDERGPRRRPTVDEVFGDVFPDTTSDEREPDRPDTDTESWHERNRPPHHDRE